MSVVRPEDLEFREFPGRMTADPLAGQDAASSVRVVTLQRDPARTAHRHPLTEEVYFVAAGSGTLWLEGETEEVGPGDIVRIPKGMAHATVPHEGEEMALVCFFPHPDLPSNTEETDIAVVEGKEHP